MADAPAESEWYTGDVTDVRGMQVVVLLRRTKDEAGEIKQKLIVLSLNSRRSVYVEADKWPPNRARFC